MFNYPNKAQVKVNRSRLQQLLSEVDIAQHPEELHPQPYVCSYLFGQSRAVSGPYLNSQGLTSHPSQV